MRRLDTFANTIDGKTVKAKLTFLHPKGISITLLEPFRCTSGISMRSRKEQEPPLVVKVNNEYVTTELGDSYVFKLHRIIYQEACSLVDDKERVRAMIEAVIARNEPHSVMLQGEFFPNINYIEMDLELLDTFAKEVLREEYDLVGRFYPKYRKNFEVQNLRQGDVFSVLVDGYPIQGRVNVLTRCAVCVSIDKPFECFASCYSNVSRFADKEDGICIANEDGDSVAKELLEKLYEQAEYLEYHKQQMGLFIKEYVSVRDYKIDCLRVMTMKEIDKYKEVRHELETLLPTMKEHYFPQISTLEFDEEFLKQYSEKMLDNSFEIMRFPLK